MVRCFYERNKRNFGDMLTPIILKWVSGDEVEYVPGNEPNKVLCIGSGMNRWLRPYDVIWGYGSRNTDQYGKIILPEGTQIWAVRGRLTRENIMTDNPGIEVPEVFGDPALLMPLIYKPQVVKSYRIGFVPHYIDKERHDIRNPEVNVIDIQAAYFQVIDEINKCEVIISTSLHGLIMADAYGIPAVWLKVSDNVLGAWFKFNDYFSAVGRGQHDPVIINNMIHMSDLRAIAYATLPPPVIDTRLLIDSWKGWENAKHEY